jgi:hypothetical protein
MRHSPSNVKLRHGVSLAAALAFGAASFDHLTTTSSVQAQAVRRPAPPAAVSLTPADDLHKAVTQTAAVVEGLVTDIKHEYSEEDGPWTRVVLSNIRVLFGAAPAVVEIRHFGGPLPNGRLVVAAELPVFVLGKEYIVFLRNGSWNVSPVVGDLALRVESLAGAEVLVNSDGQAVTKVGEGGVEIGPTVFEAPQRDGSAPRPVVSSLQNIERTLDRQRFAESLQSSLVAQNLAVAGTFIDRPAGAFKWRGQPTGGSALGRPDVPKDLLDSQRPEVDPSEPKR